MFGLSMQLGHGVMSISRTCPFPDRPRTYCRTGGLIHRFAFRRSCSQSSAGRGSRSLCRRALRSRGAATLFSLHNRHLLGHHDIEVHLGLCTNALDATDSETGELDAASPRCRTSPSSALGNHWANITVASQVSSTATSGHLLHDCSVDHIANWPEHHRVFVPFDSAEWAVTVEIVLSFTPCPLNPFRTLIPAVAVVRRARASGRVLYRSAEPQTPGPKKPVDVHIVTKPATGAHVRPIARPTPLRRRWSVMIVSVTLVVLYLCPCVH